MLVIEPLKFRREELQSEDELVVEDDRPRAVVNERRVAVEAVPLDERPRVEKLGDRCEPIGRIVGVDLRVDLDVAKPAARRARRVAVRAFARRALFVSVFGSECCTRV